MRTATRTPGARGETPEARAVDVSVVMPCLNEAATLERCIRAAQRGLAATGVRGEVIVADNGSTDGSVEIAERLGARVVHAPVRGYGAALLAGIRAARGGFVVMGDADGTYDFSSIAPFVERLRAGDDLVVGDRFAGGIEAGAMPWLNRYVGNPILSLLGRLFFRSPVRDFHCGLRAFRREAVLGLDLRTTGMEFASEMIVKATLAGLQIGEAPTTLSRPVDGRRTHLRRWRDGWRHLRFLLLYSPRWLFLYPGLALMAAGTGICVWLLPGPGRALGVTFDVQTLLYGAMAVVVGFQAVLFSYLARVYGTIHGLLPEDPALTRLFRVARLETGLAVGGILLLIGMGGSVWAFVQWSLGSFGPLDPSRTLRTVIPSLTALLLGTEVVLASFFFSILGLRRK
ncbi:MAG TPA: glycosyltransferase family 2 protein [Actinomycetota bacterium]|nr:glycosyltransferase family 2 protein [Actinomycetota bacterium]